MRLFTFLMLLLAGRMFFGSVTDLHQLMTGKPEVLHFEGKLNPEQQALLRGQVMLVNALAREHPAVLAIHAAARLALGLVCLFAVAALFSNDPRGRRVSVLAGWAGVVVSAANAMLLTLVVRKMLPALGPALATALAQDAARAGRSPPAAAMVLQQARLFLLEVPLVVTAMGIAFGLLLVAYFGGRRVRLFYNQPRQADHG